MLDGIQHNRRDEPTREALIAYLKDLRKRMPHKNIKEEITELLGDKETYRLGGPAWKTRK